MHEPETELEVRTMRGALSHEVIAEVEIKLNLQSPVHEARV